MLFINFKYKKIKIKIAHGSPKLGNTADDAAVVPSARKSRQNRKGLRERLPSHSIFHNREHKAPPELQETPYAKVTNFF